MNITITSSAHESFTLQLNYPREFSGLQQLEERRSQKKASWGNLYINELWFDGACVFQSIIEAKKACQLSMTCDSSCWLMNFVLDGELATAIQTTDDQVNLKAGQYNCLYCSNLDIKAGIQQTTRLISICLTKRYMKHLFWKSPAMLNSTLTSEQKAVIVTAIHPITQQLEAIISDIIKAEQPQYIRRIFLEGKILELLSLQLKDSSLGLATSPQPPARNDDLKKLQTVKALLEENIRIPLSLTELAKRSGLNDFKLKKQFKEVYGNTVFGYLTELRMLKAKELLQKGVTVSEVAYIVGYKNAHHFTAAFKKRFGVVPSLVKN